MGRVNSSIAILLFFIGEVAFFSHPSLAKTSIYTEFGTLVGSMTNANAFFGENVGTTGAGFVGTFGVYGAITSRKKIAHLELGFQNRLSLISGNAKSLAISNPYLAIRAEFWRFFGGLGYAPFTYSSTNGINGLSCNQGSKSIFYEVGAIWRVIPELQIVAQYALETGSPKAGGSGPIINSFGLHFRFPLDPTDFASGSAVEFDGRYPFGFMK